MVESLRDNSSAEGQSRKPRALVLADMAFCYMAIRDVCSAEVISTATEVAELVRTAVKTGSPYSILILETSFCDERMSELLEQVSQSDASLHYLIIVDDAETNTNLGQHINDPPPSERVLILERPVKSSLLRRTVQLLCDKCSTLRALSRTTRELQALQGRRSMEIAAANADLISLNHKLESAKDAAESANRAKSAFLATMSHEIRTPMTAILGYADYLLEEGDIRQAPRERIEAINTIVRNGRHLVQLINDILDLSKIEANRVEIEKMSCKPLAIVTEVVSLMRGRAEEKRLPMRVRTDGPIPESIHSDPTRIRQILVNVIGNAIKFTESGSVTITVREFTENSRRYVQFDVADTGIGLTAEQTARLFQPFSQADMSMTRRFGGTGLGLCISQRFAEMLGGRIDVSSVPGEGTTFQISIATGEIPSVMIETDDALREAAKEDPYAVAEARRLHLEIRGRILIAEDGVDNQRLFAHLLRKSGAEVTVVGNGELACEAVTEANDRGQPFDVVLMDMQMPVMDGYAATRKLRTDGCTLPIIALTAFAMTGDREKCLQAGCTDYLTKPIDRTRLLPLVAKYIQQQTLASQQTTS